MAPKKFNGVVEAVRYDAAGQVELVRIYERRGPTFSDRILLSRVELVQRLKKGERFVTGTRKPYLSSSFEVNNDLRLLGLAGGEIISDSEEDLTHDQIKSAPVF